MRLKDYIHKSSRFFNNEISDYGLEHHKVDYAALAKSFDAVYFSNFSRVCSIDSLEVVNGEYYDPESGEYKDIFQWFIIDEQGKNILVDFTDELVLFDPNLGMYIWGIDHYGTGWSYVLTDIKIDPSIKKKGDEVD